METVAASILRVGSRDQELRALSFNAGTLSVLISKLPYNHLQDKIHELDTQSEEKLRRILQLIKKAIVKAHTRASNIATNMILSGADSSLWPETVLLR